LHPGCPLPVEETMSESQWMSLVAGLLMLAWLLPGLRRLPLSVALRHIAIWLALFAVIGLGWNLYHDG
jgi:hypothetical protein